MSSRNNALASVNTPTTVAVSPTTLLPPSPSQAASTTLNVTANENEQRERNQLTHDEINSSTYQPSTSATFAKGTPGISYTLLLRVLYSILCISCVVVTLLITISLILLIAFAVLEGESPNVFGILECIYTILQLTIGFYGILFKSRQAILTFSVASALNALAITISFLIREESTKSSLVMMSRSAQDATAETKDVDYDQMYNLDDVNVDEMNYYENERSKLRHDRAEFTNSLNDTSDIYEDPTCCKHDKFELASPVIANRQTTLYPIVGQISYVHVILWVLVAANVFLTIVSSLLAALTETTNRSHAAMISYSNQSSLPKPTKTASRSASNSPKSPRSPIKLKSPQQQHHLSTVVSHRQISPT